MPSRCLTTISPVVTRLLIRLAEVDLVVLEEPRSSVAVDRSVVDDPAQVAVVAGQRAGEQPQVAGEGADRAAEAIWPWSTVLLSRISAVVTSKFPFAAWMNALPVSMICCRSSPVPSNACPSSWTVVRRASWSTDSTVVEMSASSFWVGIGVRVSAVAIWEPSWR